MPLRKVLEEGKKCPPLKNNYFCFLLLGAACESALPATFFTALLDLSLDNNLEAVEATELLVFLFLDIIFSYVIGEPI